MLLKMLVLLAILSLIHVKATLTIPTKSHVQQARVVQANVRQVKVVIQVLRLATILIMGLVHVLPRRRIIRLVIVDDSSCGIGD